MARYQETPHDTDRMPPGVPFIIGNELAERFSFYGMNAILTVFLTKYLMDAGGNLDVMSDEQAKSVFHDFKMLAYFFPIVGAIISDVFWGKYKTILLISLMYCLGHGALALMDLGPLLGKATEGAVGWEMTPFLYLGLILIAVGSGGIKPCVSAHVGDQFGPKNKHLLTQVFNWFYFSINLGAAASTLLTPLLLEHVGPWLAFGVPGVLMALATLLFWMGRHRFVHVPPSGWQAFKRETFSPEGKRAIKNLAPLFLIFIPVFWMLFDQTASTWVIQADTMNREFAGIYWLQSQIQAANPILILILIPIFTYVVYPTVGKFVKVTSLRKIGFGLFVAAGAFGVSAVIEMVIQSRAPEAATALWSALNAAGVEGSGTLESGLRAAREAGWDNERIRPFLENMPSVGWQFLAYVVMTAAEVLVSIVALEFAYTQSPKRMKSFIMGVYFLGVSLGNFYIARINNVLDLLRDESGKTPLDGAAYFWAFTGLSLLTAIVFIFYSRTYKGETFIQGDGHDDIVEAKAVAEAPGTH